MFEEAEKYNSYWGEKSISRNRFKNYTDDKISRKRHWNSYKYIWHVQEDKYTSILNIDMEGIKRHKQNFYNV